MKSILILAFALIGNICISQTIEIPDENFERALINLGIDSDEEVNGLVLKSDVQSVTSLDISNKRIKNLKGIEAFTSLKYLNCRDNKLSNVDLSQNISLEKVSSSINDINRHTSDISYVAWFDKF